MATSTFFEKIIIDEKAADRLIAEMEKPRKPYLPEKDFYEIERSGKEWLKRFVSKTSPKQDGNKNF